MKGIKLNVYRKEFKRASVCLSFNEANLSSFFIIGSFDTVLPCLIISKQNQKQSTITNLTEGRKFHAMSKPDNMGVEGGRDSGISRNRAGASYRGCHNFCVCVDTLLFNNHYSININ